MVKIKEVEIKDESYMQVVINKEDGFINGSLLSDQINMFLFREMRAEDIKNDVEHIRMLTGQREMYKADSVFENVRGWYIHPLLALEMVAIKKCEDSDYEEYYEFLKSIIFEFLDNNIELKEQYNFIEEFHG